mgnify:CR=1 FL=1
MAADLFVPFSDIDRPGLFEVTFYWGSWGSWGTYHYDYTKPQTTTLVTKTP